MFIPRTKLDAVKKVGRVSTAALLRNYFISRMVLDKIVRLVNKLFCSCITTYFHY